MMFISIIYKMALYYEQYYYTIDYMVSRFPQILLQEKP